MDHYLEIPPHIIIVAAKIMACTFCVNYQALIGVARATSYPKNRDFFERTRHSCEAGVKLLAGLNKEIII